MVALRGQNKVFFRKRRTLFHPTQAKPLTPSKRSKRGGQLTRRQAVRACGNATQARQPLKRTVGVHAEGADRAGA